ncbi:MAG: CoA ester lyase, partial [Comamonadaceae bacterium]
MAPTVRPRRSALYLPGNNLRVLEKGKLLPSDIVILDLEDAVGDEDKASSRQRVVDAVSAGDYRPREVVVRINGLGSKWHHADVAAVARSGADGVLVPKVQTGDEVRALDSALTVAGAPHDLKLWVMVETPGAFLRAEEIAAASERLAVLVIGTNDLINDLHALHRPGRAPIQTALSLAILGARTAGKSILDGVFNAIRDVEGFTDEARQGREMGFDGKTVIHPSQVEIANTVFGPSDEELSHARTVVAAYKQARAIGESVIVVDGKMIEELHVRDARRILALAATIDDLAAV